MNKEEIVQMLENKHQELFNLLSTDLENSWESGPENKWTVGQHVLHLLDSAKMLNKALSYPKFIIKYKFGVANRATRDYQTVAKRYQDRLKENQERARDFNKDLRVPTIQEKENSILELKKQLSKLQKTTLRWKDKRLDTLLLPHPLMGRMIVREVIMWTGYHTEHHVNILKEQYS
jgi:hypothetical protein